MKKGLISEGGALRSLFSAGVMDVLMEHGLEFDGLVGVSAGAAFGCNYKSRQPGRVLRYNQQQAHEWRYCSIRSLITTGDLFGGEYCYHTLPDIIDHFDVDTFDNNPMEFYAVCTDVETGRAEYRLLMHHGYECNEWIRASASMPLASRVVKIGSRKMLDGGIADSIPLKFFQQKGYDRCLVVLTQPEGYVKRPNSLMPLMRWTLRQYPEFLRAAAHRHVMYNQQLQYVRQEEAAHRAFVLRPKHKLAIHHISHDPREMQQVYDEGRAVALENLSQIINYLQ